MVVNSFNFLIFLLVVLFVYYSPLSKKYKGFQNMWLFLTSYIFYGVANWKTIPLLLSVTIVFYAIGLWLKSEIAKGASKRASQITTLGVLLGLGVLFYFKYLNFFADSFASLFRGIGFNVSWTTINVVLPIGVSFFTFKLISYVIEIHREHMEPCKDFVKFAAYVAFFPTILSGPIDRPNKFIPQMGGGRDLDYSLAVSGLRQILWGLFLKMCVADRLCSYTDFILNDPGANNGTSLLIAGLLYPMQMYADFAGYSEMAIGVGRLLGFNVTPNFDYPYLKTNIPSFWRGWHMSLTSWLTDYVFMPLNIKLRNMGWIGSEIAIIVTFTFCGLWHGANWTFVIWGLYHGLLFLPSMATGSFFKKKKAKVGLWGLPKLYDMMKMVKVYLLVAFGLIIFRATSLGEAFTVFERILFNQDVYAIKYGYMGRWYFLYTFILMLIVVFKDIKDVYLYQRIKLMENSKKHIRWATYYILCSMIIWYGINSSADGSFIYFNF